MRAARSTAEHVQYFELDSPKPNAPFSRVRIWFDDELQIPVRFVKWDSSSDPDEPLELVEEYAFVSVQVNMGLTDIDFDESNPDYTFQPFPKQQQEAAQPSTGIQTRRGRLRCFTRPRRP